MKSKLDSLLKKRKLTGAEVGRLVLANTINAYSKALSGKENPKPLFSQAQLETMVEGIEGAYNIKIYNRYISLGRWLEQEALKATAYYYNSQSAVRGYLWAVSSSYIAEEYLSEQNRAPLIMTREEYEKAINDALEKYLDNDDLTLRDLIDVFLTESFLTYRDNPRKKSLFKDELNKLAKIELPNDLKNHLKNDIYSEDDLDFFNKKRNLKETFIFCMDNDFFPYALETWENEDEEAYNKDKEFLFKYYGNLLQLVFTEIKQELRKEIDTENFSQKIISPKEAYKKDLLNFKSFADEFSLFETEIEQRGVLIKAKDPMFPNTKTISFMETTVKANCLDTVLSDPLIQTTLKRQRADIGWTYLNILAYNTVLEILAENLNINEFLNMKVNGLPLESVESTNRYLEMFKEGLESQSYLTWTDNLEEKLTLFDTCLKPIKDIIIPEERIEKLRDILGEDLEVFDTKKFLDFDIIEELIKGVEYE